jgi:3-oxoacyl-[acyl-carrier-protein] synthase III
MDPATSSAPILPLIGLNTASLVLLRRPQWMPNTVALSFEWVKTGEPLSPPATPARTKVWHSCVKLDPKTFVLTHVLSTRPCVQPVVRPTLLRVSPATASVVQHRLGLARAGTFDLNCGCASFVTALDTAWKYVRADERYRRILVVAPYAMTKFVDPLDKKTVTIFADGAGAALVAAAPRPGILASELYADGSFAPRMGVFAGGTAEPVTEAVLREGYRNRVRFVEKYPAQVNEEGWPRISRAVLARAGALEDDVALWLWTQVNRSTIAAVMERLGVPMDRTHTVMDKWGYTGSACLAMALDDAVRAGRLRPGDLVVMTGSGAGLAMGCIALRWSPAVGGW